MQEDAPVVNNQLFKGRRLAVILTDGSLKTRWRIFNGCGQPYLILPRLFSVPGSRPDMVPRSLRVKNVLGDAQEPHLQQVFETAVPVKGVETFVDSGEAVVELVNMYVR